MGYRSEVTIILNHYVAAELKEKDKELYNFLQSADTVISMSFPPSIEIFQWDWIKWYDTDDMVIRVNNYLKSLNEDEYRLVIIGEDYNDMTIEGWLNNDRVKIMRHVSIY